MLLELETWKIILVIVILLLYVYILVDRVCKCCEKISYQKTIANTFTDIYEKSKDDKNGDKTVRPSEESDSPVN